MYARKTCPWRILEDAGGAFSLGCIGGSVLESISGFRFAPCGLRRRFIGSLESIKANTPRIAGVFALWATTYSTVECVLLYKRGKDSWNVLISGAAAGGMVMVRHGLPSMATNAIMTGIALSLLNQIFMSLGNSDAQSENVASSHTKGDT
ncbi:Mitochondrial import inner membrane translocase subunit Tim17-B [Blattella germanica]|nr:Mitochondrial import inner membrane translocase subunit Tim17-B [Blattella germanica]